MKKKVKHLFLMAALSLVPMALLYRFVFILFLDVVKAFATLEELFRFDMSWGKLQRVASAPST